MHLVPEIVNLELTNRCNVACVFCDHADLKDSMAMGDMSSEMLMGILDGLADHQCHELGLVGLGEPLLAANFESQMEIIGEYVRNYAIISMNTNGVALTRAKARLILDSPITNITISLNGSHPDAYRELMRCDYFDVVVDNIKRFLEMKQSEGNPIQVGIQVVASELNDERRVRELFGARLESAKLFVRAMYNKPVLQKEGKAVLVDGASRDRHPCWSLYSRVYIDIDGSAYPCTIGNDCHRNESMRLGNVMDMTVPELFNTDKAVTVRKAAENGDIPFPECADCNIWSLLPNNFRKEKDAWVRSGDSLRMKTVDWDSKGVDHGD